MKKLPAAIFLAGLAALVLSAPIRAQILNVQIGSTSYPFTGAGADPLAGDTWNVVGGGALNDVAVSKNSSGGSLSGVSVSVGAAGFFSFYGEPNGNNLIDGYDYTNNLASFSISGLAKDAAFTIYLYGTASNQAPGRETGFTLSAANGGLSASDFGRAAAETSGTFVLGSDYVVLTGTTATGTITGTYRAFANSGGEGDFNGFQLNVTAPEPSTWALMIVGGALLVLLPSLRRRA